MRAASVVVWVLFASNSGMADPGAWDSWNSNDPAIDQDVAQRLTQEIGKSVRVLTRKVSVYHWQPRHVLGLPVNGQIDPSDIRFQGYFRQRTGSFWEWSQPGSGMVGNGLYAATDPGVSQAYGSGFASAPEQGAEWSLTVVTMPPNSRLLDLRETLRFSPSLIQELERIGCRGKNDLNGFFGYRGSLGKADESCNKTFLESIHRLNIRGVAYGWGGQRLNACSLREPSFGTSYVAIPAILLIDPSLVTQARVLVSEIPAVETAEIHSLRIRVTHFFRLIIEKLPGSGTEYYRPKYPWPSLASEALASDLIEWIQSHTYFCDITYWEDLLNSQFNFHPAELIEKLDQISEKAAKLSRKLGFEIKPDSFREVMSLRYFTLQEWRGAPEARPMSGWDAWLKTEQEQVLASARAAQPLSVAQISEWGSWLAMTGLSAPTVLADRRNAFELFVADLNDTLDHPEHARIEHLRNAYALIQDFMEKFLVIAPFDHGNERMARALADYIAVRRELPPVLIQNALNEFSSLGSVMSLLIMDKCLERYARATPGDLPALQASNCGMTDGR